MRRDDLGHAARELVAVHGERGSGGNFGFVGNAKENRSKSAHLGLQQTVRVSEILALERIGADQLGKAIGLMRRCAAHGPHLDQADRMATLGELPRGLTSGESRANDGYFS